VGWLCGAEYILRQHVPKLALAEGVSEEECEALRDWRKSPSDFSEAERAALTYTDAVTQRAHCSDAEFTPLKPFFDERQIVELTVLIGAYNMHARVLTALALDLEPQD
jgi:alkylhydroperoxidase family enzyme